MLLCVLLSTAVVCIVVCCLLLSTVVLCVLSGAQHAVEGADPPPGLPGVLPALPRGSQSHHDRLQHGLQRTLPSGVCPPRLGQPSRAGEGGGVGSGGRCEMGEGVRSEMGEGVRWGRGEE